MQIMAELETVNTPPADTPFIRPDVRAFLDFLNTMGSTPMSALTPELARQTYLAMTSVGEREPLPLPVIRDLAAPGPACAIPLRLYDARAEREPGPVILFFHGGGFVIGDLATHHAFCTELASALDLPVVAVDYRLAPEHPFPAAPDDCEAAARWVAQNPPELGRIATGLILTGDSAGGNLAIVTARALVEQPAAVPVILQAPIYPVTDDRIDHPSFREFADGFMLTADTMSWFSNAYQPQAGHPRAYPVYNDHAQTPPTVLVTAGLDPIRDSGRVYGAELVRAGASLTFLEMSGTIHGFIQLRKAIPSAQDDIATIFAAIRQQLERI
ncbi:lipolytic enzyme [Novosphingobium nitrogenifigens DSM 19370]|uniref:Lipolytic enzyme n=1 Tax=Novosphingobium nitrogenifigens DSM 19370 TaxID=983920 RepID=F1ZA99_9SPHN|nr:alpha/beta hydrolase [Novosphingobium nitrogenifigens]EGD58493.1 lipolytic enzyme [Novosphingobium nitrogenifigens DSM 19370]